MKPVSQTDLVWLLKQLHVLDIEEVQELPRLHALFPDSVQLLNHLLKRQWITRFQAHLLLNGKGRKLLFGSYVLLDLIGSGGMGRVFKARNWKLGRVVSLKIVKPELLTRPDAVRRFYREVRAFAQLDHPFIVRAYDATDFQGIHSVAMEYVDGSDLAKFVADHGEVSYSDTCRWIYQAAIGLEHAHQRGILHRDIKPSNLLLDKQTRDIKLTDLGLARLFEAPQADSATLTGMGRLLGTPDFIAPEQVRNAHGVDGRADIYSLGCTAYFLLTGRVPFPGGTPTEKMLCHLKETPEPLHSIRTDVPLPVCEFIHRMMSKNSDHRPSHPQEVAEAFARFHELPPRASSDRMIGGPDSLSRVVPVEDQITLLPTVEVEVDHLWIAQSDEREPEPVVPNPAPPPRPSRPRWLVLTGAIHCLLAIALIVFTRSMPQVPDTDGREWDAENESVGATWEFLKNSASSGSIDPNRLREQLLAFRYRFYEHPHAREAARLLRTIPSPLDELIQPEELPDNWPPEWVAGWEWRANQWERMLSGSTFVQRIPPIGTTAVFFNRGLEFLVSVPGQPIRVVPCTSTSDPEISIPSTERTLSMLPSPDGQLILVFDDSGLTVRNPHSDEAYPTLSMSPASNKLAAFLPDQRHIVVALEQPYPMVRVYNLTTGAVTMELEVRSHAVQSMCVAPAGNVIAISDPHSLRLISLHDGMLQHNWGLEEGRSIQSMAFSPDGKVLYSIGMGGNLCVWDTTGDSDVGTWPGHSTNGRCLVLSPDGDLLATVACDGELILWDAKSCEKRRRIRFPSSITRVEFSPDGRHLLATHQDGTISLLRSPDS